MKKSSLTIGLSATTLLFLAAAGGASALAWQYRERATKAERNLKVQSLMPVTTVTELRPTPVIVAADNSDLHARILELEAALAERDAYINAMTQESAFAQEDNAPRRNPGNNNNAGGGGRPNFENLAQTDPQRYAEIQAQRDAFRQRMEQAMADRKSFFERAPETLSADMQGTYAAVRSLLDQSEQFGQLMMSPDLSPEERRELGTATRELMERLNPLLQNVRREELMSLAAGMGYNTAGQRQFADYVDKMFEVTTQAPTRFGGGPGGGFGGGGNNNNRGGAGGGRGGRGN